MSPSTPARKLAWGPRSLVVLVVVALAGCGLSADSQPNPIAAEDLPADLLDPNPPASTTLPDSAATIPVTVYLVKSEGDATRLVPVEREVVDASRARDRIDAVLVPTSAEEQALGLVSSVPTDTVLLDTSLVPEESELVVNLSNAIFDVQGKELAKAFAQLVWTVTELPTVRQVRFRVDGRAYRAPNAEGIEQDGAVTRGDYNAFTPTR